MIDSCDPIRDLMDPGRGPIVDPGRVPGRVPGRDPGLDPGRFQDTELALDSGGLTENNSFLD